VAAGRSEIATEYPDVEVENQLVDSCAMRLIQNRVQSTSR